MAYGKWSVKWSPIYGQWVVRTHVGSLYSHHKTWANAYRTADRMARRNWPHPPSLNL